MSNMSNSALDSYGNVKRRPPPTKWQQIKNIMYNKEEKSVLTRTGSSWAKIGLFYGVFYVLLAGLCMFMMSVFLFMCIDEHRPYLTGMDSILKLSPGLSLSGTIQRTKYEAWTKSSFEKNKELLEKQNLFLEKLTESKDKFGICSSPSNAMKENVFCSYWKVNKVYGYLPDIDKSYNSTDILVECSGSRLEDKKNIGNPVYYPSVEINGKKYGKLSTANFPYVTNKKFESPVVAITFPEMTLNVEVKVKCQMVNLKQSPSATQLEMTVHNATETTRT